MIFLCGTAGGLASVFVVGMGGFAALDSARIIMFSILLALLGLATFRRVTFKQPPARAKQVSKWISVWPMLVELEVALAAVSVIYATLWMFPDSAQMVYPTLYVGAAFAGSFSRWGVVGLSLATAGSMEYALVHAGRQSPNDLAVHVTSLIVFSILHWVFMRGLIRAQQNQNRRRVMQEANVTREEIRDFRLLASSLSSGSKETRTRKQQEDMLLKGGADAVRSNAKGILELTRSALSAETAALVWLYPKQEVVLRAVSTVSETPLVTLPMPARMLHAVLRAPQAQNWASINADLIPYYQGKSGKTSVAVCPIVESGRVRGLVCVDRKVAFREWEISTLESAAKQIEKNLESEKLFLAVERAKYEYEKFFHASASLCQALTPEQVMTTALESAAQIAPFDVALVTAYHNDRRKHSVMCLQDDSGGDVINTKGLVGLEFGNNKGLVSMVVKNRHFLPAAGEVRDNLTHILTPKFKLKRASSLLVLPLLVGDKVIGTLVLISKEKGVYGRDVREMLSVIANQVAISLENGVLFKKMEQMATTDGLTNLTNHRTFQQKFEALLDSSGRHGRKLSVLLCDIDHFKSVNDTYGHPVGDEVLRRVSKVLKLATRKIDVPARYGGEEFAVVLDATDEDGATKLADRIRQDVESMVIPSEKGSFKVTMSIGVATFPADGHDRGVLIENADQSLYYAKENGRNQVVHHQTLQKKHGVA